MNSTKSALASKTIWGAALSLVSTLAPIVLPMLGVTGAELAAITGAFAPVAAAAGAVLAIYGRLTAKKAIG